jgi:hypothetical protein
LQQAALVSLTLKLGHGSKFIEPSATVRLLRVLNKFAEFRETEQARLGFSMTETGRPLNLGDVTTTNITMLNAGDSVLIKVSFSNPGHYV